MIRDCADRVGCPEAFPFPSTEAALNHLLSGLGSAVTMDTLHAQGGQWSRQARAVGHADGTFATASGRVEFASAALEQWGLPRLPLPQPPGLEDSPFPFLLRTGRSSMAFHSFYDEDRMLSTLRHREPHPVVWINHADAQSRQIPDGADIEVYNAQGVLPARARVSPDIVAGALWMRDGWFGLNALTASAVPLSPQAAAGLGPIRTGTATKYLNGGQSSYAANVDIRLRGSDTEAAAPPRL